MDATRRRLHLSTPKNATAAQAVTNRSASSSSFEFAYTVCVFLSNVLRCRATRTDAKRRVRPQMVQPTPNMGHSPSRSLPPAGDDPGGIVGPVSEGPHSESARDSLGSLAGRARSGEPQATARLCAICAPLLRTYLASALRRSDDDPEDAVQQVLLQMLESIGRFRGEEASFRAWLFSIARNVAIDRMRASARRPAATDPHDLSGSADDAQSGLAWSLTGNSRDPIASLIAPLPLLQRQVLTLIYLHDLSPAQAGRVLGRSPEAIRQLSKRARDVLRAIVLDQAKVV